MNSVQTAKPAKPQPRKILLNHDLCRVVEENGKFTLYVKMANGSYAVQRPYDADLRGAIGALTLALDVLAGKIILGGVVQLNESEFQPRESVVEVLTIGQGGSNE
jgi:hypothetical protein